MKKGGSGVPWKMIFFLVVLAFVVFFAGFNITNVSDISFGFYTIVDVPIFISLFIAFIAGAVIMIPFVARSGKAKKRKERTRKQVEPPSDDEIPEIPALDESDSPRFKNKKKQ
ncbi:MAG: hypothetical protein JW852_05780 [Spirochaetales bacterium]|nr:hypothetical protein [Spirochaetales bacterium]